MHKKVKYSKNISMITYVKLIFSNLLNVLFV